MTFTKKSTYKKAAGAADLPVIGHFFVNKTADGKPKIQVNFPDGTRLFLNFAKDSKEKGLVVLGGGGKPYELKERDVVAKFAITEKAEAAAYTSKATSKTAASSKFDDMSSDDLFA